MRLSFIPLPGVDEAVFAPREGGLFRARRGKRWGYLDLAGQVVVPFAFAEAANAFGDGRAAVNRKQYASTWGYVARGGELVIPHRYASATTFAEQRAVVARETRDGWRWGFVDPDGVEVVPCVHSGATPFCDGLAGLRGRDYVAHFIRPDGSRAFAFASDANTGDAAFAFANGFAAVCTSAHRWGFIDRRGEAVGTFRYDKCWAFAEGRGAVAHRVGTTNDDHEDSLYQVGYIDEQGVEVIAPRFGGGYPFREGLARVDLAHPRECERHQIGFIDRDGREVVPCVYDAAQDFRDGLAAVRQGKKWGYVDTRGQVVLDFRFDYAGPFVGGVAAVGIYGPGAGSYGYIDRAGRELLACEHSWASEVHAGVALVEQGGGMGPGFAELAGAKHFLVVFGADVAVDREAAAAAIGEALVRAQAVEADADAHRAWSALDGALVKLASADERERVLGELARTTEQPILLEHLAAQASARHDDEAAAALLARALAARPGQPSLLLGLQSLHLRRGELEAAAEVGTALAAAGWRAAPAWGHDDAAAKLDEMHALVNAAYARFAAGQSIATLIDEAARAAELEQELLAYWQAHSLSGRDIPPGRGELAASGMYIAALRQARRSGAAAAWFRRITADRHLLGQCLRDFVDSAENTLNNGLGALCDTRAAEDLAYGGELLALLDQRQEGFSTPLLPLACACLATLRGELERALGYLEVAIAKGRGVALLSDGGSDIVEMAKADPDLAPLRARPEFARIVGGGRPPRQRRRRSKAT